MSADRGRNRRISDIAVALLPQPDSPTIASTSPRLTSKLTPRTAGDGPRRVRNVVVRSRTDRIAGCAFAAMISSVEPFISLALPSLSNLAAAKKCLLRKSADPLLRFWVEPLAQSIAENIDSPDQDDNSKPSAVCDPRCDKQSVASL